MAEERPYIGGAAVLEGVMMRSPRGIAIAVRRPDGSIALREGDWKPLLAGRIWKVPLLRGIATLVDALQTNWSSLRWSAEQQMSPAEVEASRGGSSRLPLVIGGLLAIGLFVALPQGLALGASWLLGQRQIDAADPRFIAITGGFKLIVVVGYLLAISRLPDVRRLFQYHGAEHKVITTIEAGLDPSVENARRQTTLHPRCGTTFFIVVVMISFVVFLVVTPFVIPHATGAIGQAKAFAIKLPLLPVIAGIAYELQRFMARYCLRGPLRALLWPGFLVQKITTRQPTDEQLEIAIVAMRAAAWRQSLPVEVRAVEGEPLVYASFDEFAKNAGALRPTAAPALAA